MDGVLQSSKFQIKLSELIHEDWYKIGIFLNVERHYVDAINNDNINYRKQENKAYEMINKWFNIDKNPTFEKLKDAILNIPKCDLFKKVENLADTFLNESLNSPSDTGGSSTAPSYPSDDTSNTAGSSTATSYPSDDASNPDLLRMSDELKKYYLKFYEKISELQPFSKASVNVDLIQKFVDLCIVDAVNAQVERLVDTVFSVERKEFLEKQISYTPIPYSEIFAKQNSLILISGIAGIGKTWLLRKCLLDWSNGLIWKNVELVFYLECRRLNQHQNISNINELLNVFYKDIVKDFKFSNHTALFIIDGLDEFKYFNDLINPSLTCNYPIVNALEEIQKYKHVIAGRVYAIDQYQKISTEHSDKLTIQIMGFNENGINNYVENHVVKEKKEVVKTTLRESPNAKAMASVPFYLSSICKIISYSKKIDENSFLTMTDLYTNIFLYFLRKHIIKNNKFMYEIMEDSSNKKYILNICKIAYKMFVNNKIVFSKDEIQAFINDFDRNKGNFFGFIERIETDLGCYYQFTHLTIMEFCASVYAYNCLSSDEIMADEKLKRCLSMICGLANKNPNSLLKFLVNLDPSKKSYKESSLLIPIFGPSITMRHRNRIWEDIMSHLNSLGAKIEDINQLRNREWDYLRRATMQKFAKSLKTGAAGRQLTELDNVVLDILDRKSINVSGINVPDFNISFCMTDDALSSTPNQLSTPTATLSSSSKEVNFTLKQSSDTASFISSMSDNTTLVGDSRQILQDSIQNKPSMGALKNLKRKQARKSLLVDGSFKKFKVSVLGLEKERLEKEQELRVKLLKLDVALRQQQIRKEKALTIYYTTATKLMHEKMQPSNQQHFVNTDTEEILLH
ncbi:uncharacterized protein LOC136075018 isoform X4 [Hydra vulgaris]|uniref:Uncharacterized protein LOC136075018 isoform X4 n=1 Tax=Hydra vulgaris TaxID=6087 RepID=A0ABM4B388_HYDVU